MLWLWVLLSGCFTLCRVWYTDAPSLLDISLLCYSSDGDTQCLPKRRGFYNPDSKPVPLTRKSVDGIQLQGGTILGTSRGGANLR